MAPIDDALPIGGKVIALEGDCDMIATQLHLLPPSTDILIFPSFQQVFSKPIDTITFDPRAFIADIHAAYTQRIQAAQSFLEASPGPNPRLVFMNGGSIRARTICIESICENITAGQVGAAETLFNNLIKDGVAGLLENNDCGIETSRAEDFSRYLPKEQIGTHCAPQHLESTITALETATQRSSCANDNASIRNVSLMPLLAIKSHLLKQEKSQGDNDRHQEAISTVPSDSTIRRWTFEMFPEDISCLTSSLKLSKYSQELDQDKINYSVGIPTRYMSLPPSETPIESSPTVATCNRKLADKTKRPKSFEYNQESRPSYRCLKFSRLNQSKTEERQSFGKLRDSSCEISTCEIGAQSAFLKAYQTTIIRNPLLTSDEAEAENDKNRITIKTINTLTKSLIPVLEPLEDFVIHVTSGITDVIFDMVLRSCQNRKNLAPRNQINSIPITPFRASMIIRSITEDKSSNITDAENINHATHNKPINISPDESSMLLKDDQPTNFSKNSTYQKILTFAPENSCDPVAIHNCLRRLLSNHLPAGKCGFSQYRHVLSTDADRLWKPVFNNSDVSEGKIQESAVDLIIALGLDDIIKKDSTTQISGMVEQLGRKKNGENRSSKLDIRYLIAQILQNSHVIPSDHSVFDPFAEPSLTATLLIPQLETYLANNVSTKLLVLHFLPSHLPIVFALRDLIGSSLFKIAGIMSGPSSEPSLISCPPSPLTPNPLSNDAVASRNRTRGHSAKGSVTSSYGILRTTISKPPSPSHTITFAPTIAQSDYLLPNSATDVEIATFISIIQKTLVEKSDYYTPEPEPEPKTIIQVVEKYLTAPTPALSFTTTQSRPSSQRRPSTQDGVSTQEGYFNLKNKRFSKVSQLTRNSSISRSPSDLRPKHNHSNSIASSRRTFVSKLTVDDVDNWENFEICEDDSDFDDFDRMIMGRRMAAMVMSGCLVGAAYGEDAIRERGMASKRKALKWLGLA